MKPQITVITPTARWGGVDIWRTSLQRQTFQNFEALFIDEHYNARWLSVRDYLKEDARLQHIKPPAKDRDDFWNLSKSLNYGLMLVRGELVVFLQDFIWLGATGLEKFWERYQEVGPALISGVGHKGAKPDWAVNLKGQITIFSHSGWPESQKPEDKPEDATNPPEGVWFRDPRMQSRGFHLCNPIEWEGNWSCVARKIANEIGGFDEDFDKGWGYDNCNFAERAQLAGYHIWLDELNECIGFSHEKLFDLSEREWRKTAPNNMKLWEQKIDRLQKGQEAWKVPHLGLMWERAEHKAIA